MSDSMLLMMMDDDSDEYRQAFQTLTPNRELNETIYEYAKKSIIDNWGTNKENMFLIDMDSGEKIASIEREEDKIEFGIIYTDEFERKLADAIQREARIVAIHNHPNGYPPTLDDISKIAENHYELAIAAGANGLIYKYDNPDKVIFTKKECQENHKFIAFNI